MTRSKIYTVYLDNAKLQELKRILAEHIESCRLYDCPVEEQETKAILATLDAAEDRGEGCTF